MESSSLAFQGGMPRVVVGLVEEEGVWPSPVAMAAAPGFLLGGGLLLAELLFIPALVPVCPVRRDVPGKPKLQPKRLCMYSTSHTVVSLDGDTVPVLKGRHWNKHDSDEVVMPTNVKHCSCSS